MEAAQRQVQARVLNTMLYRVPPLIGGRADSPLHGSMGTKL